MILSGLFCGALLGFVMQRGRFCLTGGFRDMYIAKNNRMFYALLIAIAIQSVGVFALIQLGYIRYSAGAFPGWALSPGAISSGWGLSMRAVARQAPGIAPVRGLLAAGLRSLPIC